MPNENLIKYELHMTRVLKEGNCELSGDYSEPFINVLKHQLGVQNSSQRANQIAD